MSRLTRDGTAEPVSRDQILRHARGQRNLHFPCSADHEQDWQPYPVDPYSAICDDHTYIHTYIPRGPHYRVSARAMTDRRKCGAPVGLMSSPRPRQRFRPSNFVHWTQLLYMVCSCSSARECCSTPCPCDQLHFTITIVHWTQLLYMVRSCSSARECCST